MTHPHHDPRDDDFDLLDALLDAEGVAAEGLAIPRRGVATAPLSSAQERLFVLHALDPLSSAYTIAGAVALSGPLDAAALEAAIAGVVARHEALRTTFEVPESGSDAAGEEDEGAPRQVVHPSMLVPLTREIDGGGTARAAAEKAVSDLASRPWDLAAGPLLRATLVALGEREHVLALAMHHIVADGWSIGILLREIAALYEARLAGVAAALPAPPIQYGDYAAWQRAREAAGAFDGSLRAWRETLAHARAELTLPLDRPRPTTPANRSGAMVRFRIPRDTRDALERLARGCGTTTFAALLAGFAGLMGRLSGESDVVVGTPVANRSEAETAGLIGLFVNTIPVRVRAAGDEPLETLVRRAGDSVRAALALSDVPFEMIVEAATARRVPGGTPLFQVLFAYQDAPVADLRLRGLEARPLDVDDGTAKFDLTLNVERREEELACALEYDSGLFDAATAERFAAGYQRLVEALATRRGTALSEVDLGDGTAPFESERRPVASRAEASSSSPGARAAGAVDEGRTAPDASPDQAFAGPIEEIVAGVWCEVLGVERVSPTDSFFDVGGHSLLATRVAARLRRLLSVDLPLRAFFESTTVRALAARIQEMQRVPSPPLARATDEARRLPSFAQWRLWFLDRLEPGSAAYNIANAVRIDGPLDAEALARALAAVVARHEPLRTRFPEGPDGPVAVVEPDPAIPLVVEDLTECPEGAREDEARRRAELAARRPFDLARGPVLAARLLRLAERAHVLVLVVHHIASDGWSMGVLVADLATAYAAARRGEAPVWPPLEVQYADWAAWQRAWLDGGETDRQLGFWRRELAGLPPLALPTDRRRPARPTQAGVSIDVALPAGLTARLARSARGEGATLHMALLAAFAAVLSRWSGQRDFGIGTPVAGRTQEESEPLVGFFVNSLVVRARLEEPPSRGGGREPLAYRKLLGRLREAALGAYAHQDVPFERVVEELQPERDLSRTPLFQVMFALQNAPAGALDLDGATLTPLEAPTRTSTFDLTLSLAPAGQATGRALRTPLEEGGLEGFLEYSTELFEEATVHRLFEHFVRLLEAVADDPGADVHRVSLLGAEERARAVVSWSGAASLDAPGPLLHERFLAYAAADPARLAGVLGDRRMTYGELAERSERLAARLEAAGVRPESRVGICLPRGPEMLVAMIGVHRAGGAFVPLDPDHPRERNAYALADAQARLVLATRATAAGLEAPGAEILLVEEPDRDRDRDGDAASGDSRETCPGSSPVPTRTGRPLSRDNLAYVCYTSGTTGRPKGVMVTHGALAGAITAWERIYELPSVARHLQMAGIAFDVCTGDVARALGSGGALVFCDRERLLDPAALFDLARRERVEMAEFVPAVMRALASEARGHGERLESLKTLIVASDVWTSAEVDEFRGVVAVGARLANSYGVTEATIDSTCTYLQDGDADGAAPPIGHPLSHATVYVLDEAGEPAPVGVAGEIYIGGPGVARGYAGRPDLTAEKFVPDPFGAPGARLYRTGDRARYLTDGRIAFVGRVDDQVKVRGVRVEPREVEAALAADPAVAACAVVARPDPGGVPRLAAYVVPRAGAAFDPDAARTHLRARLPEAMVPSAIVVLDALPLTPNRKVDRRALPEPRWEPLAAYEAPQGREETAVAEAFAAVLERPRIGAGDDFFALGGHSLLATRVVSRLRAALGVEVPLRTLFEAPSVRALAARIASLDAAHAPPPVTRASDAERRKASFAQTRLWFLDRLDPGSAAYNLPSEVRMEGALDVAALEHALSEIVRRHEPLRTRFEEGPDGPEAIVDPPSLLPLRVVDLAALRPEERAARAQEITSTEARAPFDLACGPLLRAVLLRLGDVDHSLVLTVAHVAADGWSLGILLSELSALYGARVRGETHPLPELPVAYADWAAWQRRWLATGEGDRQLAWWRRELEGVPALRLPRDHPRPARPSMAGGSLALSLGDGVRDGLVRLAGEERTTLHTVLLAAYGLALARWSQQKDFAVGTPVANRRTAEAEPLIGFFVNTLAVRLRLEGRLSFRGLLDRVRETMLKALANQDVPFERVVEELAPERGAGHDPLIQTLFALQNAPAGESSLPGLALSYEEPDTGVTRYDVELFFAETPEGLQGLLNFNAEAFDRESVRRFTENLVALMEAVSTDPDAVLDALPALAPAQLRALRALERGPAETYADPPLVHALVERAARLAPGASAARHGAVRIRYEELNECANRLARFLRAQGVGGGALVAVCVERSCDMLVALLGILKAGAAFVPVDPEYPRERIALILEDAAASLVVSQSVFADRLAGTGVRTILLDAERDRIAREDGGDLSLPVAADVLAYVVYTSGSTGRPKGVAMSHRAISNMLAWQRRDSDRGGIAPRTLQFASLSFDVSFQEIFSTLTAGGEIVLVSEEERRDAVRLLRIVAEAQVERLFLPFVALDQIAEAAASEDLLPASLVEIDTAGEQLRITPAIRSFFARLRAGAGPDCRLVNHYGPSEAHLVTTHALTGDPADWDELPSIGRPIANASVHLLDDEGRPVPLGAPGEIYVGGEGLARGYQGRADLTAERFVPSPLQEEPGARLYRTGDLARFTPDGTLLFLGRRDLQVKIRGYRVEPGEIEAALVRHPAVRQAAVAVREARGGKRLAAYVVLADGAHASPGELRAHLAESLPEYMVPASIQLLDALPLTTSGKVDRVSLPDPQWRSQETGGRPRTPEEEIVCGIFAEVLGVPEVGPHDGFFDLGGHSLLATAVISRVRRSLGAEVPLRVLFESATPAGVAEAALAARRAGAPAPPPLRPAAPDARRAPSFAQRRLWFLHALEPDSAVYNLPAAVRLSGSLDAGALEAALAAVVARHEALRTRFVQGPDGPEAVVDPPSGPRLALEDLARGAAETADEALRRVLAEEASRPFDLAAGPVLRARLLRVGREEHVLSLVVHHIAADGWSLGILVREIGALCAARASGAADALADPRVQYADWAAWQRGWLAGGEEARQLAWWRDELRGAPPALTLPTDRARPARLEGRGATLDVRLPASLVARLAAFARAQGATLHMALLACYAWTLMRHAGQSEIVVGTPVANRRAAEAEDLVGFFVNMLPVRVRASSVELDFRGLLARVREASLGAYGHQDVPFERIVEEIQPERALNRTPLFQTAFALQNAPLPRSSWGGLAMAPVEADTGTSKFDLMLVVEEREDGGIEGAFEYSTELFDHATIAALAERLERVLDGAVAAAEAPLADLPLVDPEEVGRVLALGTAGTRSPAPPELLTERIARTIARCPRAPAVASAGGVLTYTELGARAALLAHTLRGKGIGPEERVAVLMERSTEAIVAMVAIFEAGGVWVPLDPAQPAERLRFLVQDSGARIAIARAAGEEDVLAALEGLPGVGSVLLDRDGRVTGEARARGEEVAEREAIGASFPSPASPHPASLAYIIYTSGSTGRPKGVGVEHRQIAAYVDAAIHALGIGPGLRFAHVSALAADLGHTSLFPALATGGCLDLLPPEIAFDAPAAERWFSERPIDVVKIVPSHLQGLLGGPHPERVMPRRLLVLGGEATSGSRLGALARLVPDGCRIAVHYGPTEATVGAVAGFPAPADARRANAPLGLPLANARVYVLDGRGRPAPPGVPGEIALGGACVARGYAGRPDLTAERFVPDPFAKEPGARLYRTGDRARWLRDGRLEFLGRADGQVKVRGWRIETGEVASVVAAVDGVREAAVVVRDDPPGPSLAAYVVAEPRVSPVVHGLARRVLPDGLAVAELNRNETDYLHREIFGLRAYVRHGLSIRAGDTVVDAGANIGLFSVFAALSAPDVRLVACEPNPVLQPILRANLAAYAPGAVAVEAGLADRAREATFVFFPGFSLLSGLHADADLEKTVVRSYLENLERQGEADAGALVRASTELLAERFRGRPFTVPLLPLSDLMAAHGLERIHLLKVNVEKAELELLRGIRDEDWARIDQAVVEVDVAESLDPILALFDAHGFETLVEQDPLLARTELRYVHAARRGSGRTLVPGAMPPPAPPPGPPLLTADVLRARARRTLPEVMVPSTWTFLDALPLTANGKLDRARLPRPRSGTASYAAPRGEIEKAIAAIWAEALGRERVGIHDNFFDLGGHSLLLARVHARLRESLGTEITIVELFRHPTIEMLARRLADSAVPGAGVDRPAGAPSAPAAGHESAARGARRREWAKSRARTRSTGSPGGGAA